MKFENVRAKSATAESYFSLTGPRTLLTTITFMRTFCTLIPIGLRLYLCSYIDNDTCTSSYNNYIKQKIYQVWPTV